jgi:succinoglycan biosynthesis transport protein ExoP
MRSDYDQNVEASAAGDVDLTEIAHALSRKRRWVIGPTLIALIGALLYVNLVKPRYSAEARVLLENQENYLTRPDKGERADQIAPDPEAVGSQIQLLTSRDLARRAIKSLDLHGNVEFDPLAKGIGPLTQVLVLFGLTRDPTRLAPEDRILESYFERLTVLSPTKTRVLSIEFTSRDPDLSARAANSVAESYIEMQQEAKREQAHLAAQSLGKLVTELQMRVAEAESRAEDFRAKMGLLVGSNNTTVATQQLGDLNNQLSVSRVAQADAQAKAKLLREMLHQNRVGEIPDVANNELIRRIAEQRVSLGAQLALESRTLLHAHPRIKELRAQLANLDVEWRKTAERTARTLENDARIAGSRVENLTHALDEQKKIAGAAGADEVRLRELERVARLLKEELEADTAKYQEAVARDSIKASPADARIIQRALAPQVPSFPKKLPITAFATLAAFVLSAGGIVAGELLSGRPRVRRERRDAPAAPPLAAPAAPLTASATPARSAIEPGRKTQTEAEQPNVTVQPKARASSLTPTEHDGEPDLARNEAREGEPTFAAGPSAKAARDVDAARAKAASVNVLVAVCDEKEPVGGVELARALSRRGLTILAAAHVTDVAYDGLVGGTEGKPQGLADLIAGSANFGEVIYRDAGSRLHVMPAGSGGGAAEYDAPLVLDALAQTYDFVVFATASIERAQELAPLFDMVFVQGEGKAADAARAALLSAGAMNVSILDESREARNGLVAA